MKQEYFHSFTPTDFPFDILTSGITTSDKHHIVERENCLYYILEYICAGSGILICNDTQYQISAGDVILIPKGSKHKYFSKNQWTKIWFNMSGTLVTTLIHSYNMEKTVLFRNYQNQKLFEAFYNITTSSEPIENIISLSALKFHEIIQELFFLQTMPHSNTAYAVKKIIDGNLYQKEFSLSEIARKLFISQTKLIAAFKDRYHTTPYQYYTNKKMSLAASLLLNSDYSISQIADILNYSNPAAFSNAFKKNMGLSPKIYRATTATPASQVTTFIDE